MSVDTQIKRKYEVLFMPKVNRAIRSVYNKLIAVVKTNGINVGISSLNNQLANPELTKAINELYATVGNRFANNSYKSLKQQERGAKKGYSLVYEQKADPQNGNIGYNQTWVDWILNYLRQHLIENITFNVNRTTKDHLLTILSQSIEKGLGIDETVRLLQTDDFSEIQAARIVRTEVNMASNAGTIAAGKTYEYQMQKEWVSVEDNRTRGVHPKDHASHIGLNGSIIDFDDVFVDPRNGDTLVSPGDPKASAESIINCRCQLVLSPKRDNHGRLMPKRQTTTVIYPNQNRTRQRTVLI